LADISIDVGYELPNVLVKAHGYYLLVEDAVKLFPKIDASEIIGFIAATTITNIYYIIRFFGSFYGKPGSKPLKALLCRHFIENMVIIVYNPCPVRVLL
jgi:hypothetical protein